MAAAFPQIHDIKTYSTKYPRKSPKIHTSSRSRYTTCSGACAPDYAPHSLATDSDTKITCTYCSHLASRLRAKEHSLRKAGRHIPYGLVQDRQKAEHCSVTYPTRDDNRILVCPVLKEHRCELCGQKGHTRSRCSPCEYCGEIGHARHECPKELADQRAKGETIVLKALSPDIRDAFLHFIQDMGFVVREEKTGYRVADWSATPTDDEVIQRLCHITAQEYEQDSWDVITA